MQFCSECHNMYYLKIQDENGVIGDTLIYYCRNCGHEDKTLSTTNICVSDIQLRTSEKKYTHIVNEYTKYDPTLPRINTIKCPNQDCLSNGHGQAGGQVGGQGQGQAGGATGTTKIKIARTKKATATDVKNVEQAAEKAVQASQQAQASLALAEANLATIMAEEQLAEEEEEQEEQSADPTQANNREVIYIRYDDINMKYVYLCVHCDTTWRTDNRL